MADGASVERLRAALKRLLLPARIGRRTCIHFMANSSGRMEQAAREYAAMSDEAIKEACDALAGTGEAPQAPRSRHLQPTDLEALTNLP